MRILLLTCLASLAICCHVEKKTDVSCTCDTVKYHSSLQAPQHDTTTTDFYDLDSTINKQFWFAEIETIDSTKYTKLWDAYHDNNFTASHTEFKKHYKKNKDIELALQLGPGGILWSYHTFLLRKEQCCFVFIHTVFTHARFRYKSYAFVSSEKVDSLYAYIDDLKGTQLKEEESHYYPSASIIDRRNEITIDVPMERVSPESQLLDSSIFKLLTFLDTKIKWTETYPLRPEVVYPKTTEQVTISGSYKSQNHQGNFTGIIDIEKRENYIYYNWSIASEKNELLAAKSSTIDFKKIPDDQDQFDYAKTYVVTEIKEYSIKDKKIVLEIAPD